MTSALVPRVESSRMPGLRAALVAAALALAVTAATGVSQAADDVPANRQAVILSRALAYDSNLKVRAGSQVTIAVLVKPGERASEAGAAAIMQAWRALAGIKIHGLPMIAMSLDFAGATPLLDQIAARGIDAFYVTPGFDTELPAIMAASRQRGVVTMAARRDQVARGLSLGVFSVDNKPTMVINLAASRAEGAAFATDLLRLAVVIK